MAKAGDGYLVGKLPSGYNPVQVKHYIQKSQKRISKNQKIINEKVQDWYTFSTTPQTEEDIRKTLIRELAEKEPGKYMCLSYVCKHSVLSENFIEELITLTNTKSKRYNTIDRNNYGGYVSRIDWKNICRYQKLSEEFIERHKNDVLWNYIYLFQDLSEEFKKKHKCDYEETSLIEDSDDESEDIH